MTSTTEVESSGHAPEDGIVPQALTTNPTEASSHEPEVTTTPFNTASYSSEPSVSAELTQKYAVLETTQATTTSASSTADLTPNPESTTLKPEPDDTENAKDTSTGPDLSTSVTPVGPGSLSELDILTTHTPSSTAAVENDGKDDVTPEVTTTDPVKVTSPSSKPKPSEAISKPQEKPDTHKPSPTKPTLVKPTTKPDSKPQDTAQTLNTDDPRDYQAGKICSHH